MSASSMSASLELRELTARGRGAIRVLELAGAGALDRVQALVPGRRLVPGGFGVVALRDAGGGLLDEALALVDSPARVELHLHGAPALVRRVVAELGVAFTERVSLALEARAERHLAQAQSEAAARMLLDQVRGALRAELEALLSDSAAAAVERARELAVRGAVARWLVQPPCVVLAGPVNAGKSTLFNLLVGRDRAVVHPEPGTTRDVVRERVQLGAYAVELCDTAGGRELSGADASARVERAGQALADGLAASADLVLRLVPPGAPLPPRSARTVAIRSQSDRMPRADADPDVPALSVHADPRAARGTVEQIFRTALALPPEPWGRGRGVPFEPHWTAALAGCEPAELARMVAGWLAAD
jgi:tRNA modification GTPase